MSLISVHNDFCPFFISYATLSAETPAFYNNVTSKTSLHCHHNHSYAYTYTYTKRVRLWKGTQSSVVIRKHSAHLINSSCVTDHLEDIWSPHVACYLTRLALFVKCIRMQNLHLTKILYTERKCKTTFLKDGNYL